MVICLRERGHTVTWRGWQKHTKQNFTEKLHLDVYQSIWGVFYFHLSCFLQIFTSAWQPKFTFFCIWLSSRKSLSSWVTCLKGGVHCQTESHDRVPRSLWCFHTPLCFDLSVHTPSRISRPCWGNCVFQPLCRGLATSHTQGSAAHTCLLLQYVCVCVGCCMGITHAIQSEMPHCVHFGGGLKVPHC